MSCKLNYKGKEYTETELIDVLSKDYEILNRYSMFNNQSFQRGPETINVFDKKVKYMQKQMDADVIIDRTVETSRLLKSSDPRVKKAGKPVILINPENVFSDTVIHEFGHIFIDSLPMGMKNPKVISALSDLKGTALEARVKKLYPELSGERFEKELLATAIGMKASEIWENEVNGDIKINSWNTFIQWMKGYINRVFNVKGSAVERLSRELINPAVEKEISDLQNEYDQEQRTEKDDDLQDIIDGSKSERRRSSLDVLYDDIGARISNLESWRKNLTTREKERKAERAGVDTAYQKAKNLNEEYKKFREVEKIKGFTAYIDYTQNRMFDMDSFFNEKNLLENWSDIEDSQLVTYTTYIESFDALKDISQFISTIDEKNNDYGVDKKMKSEIQVQISNIDAYIKKNKEIMLSIKRKKLAKRLSENDIREFTIAKEKLGEKFDTDNPKGSESERRQYIEQEFLKIKDAVVANSFDKYLDLVVESPSDITNFEAWAVSEKQMNSRPIQMVSRMIEEAELRISKFFASEASIFDERNKKFSENYSGSMEKKYEGMYSFSKSGQGYFAGEYSPDYIEEYRDYKQMSLNPDTYDEFKDLEVFEEKDKFYYLEEDGTKKEIFLGSFTSINKVDGAFVYYDIKGEEYTKPLAQAIGISKWNEWQRENVNPNGTPMDKWKNKEWESLPKDKKDELNFLTGRLKAGAEYNQSDLRSFAGKKVSLYRLPGIRRSGIERTKSMDMKGIIRDSLESMYKVQEDDYDVAPERASGVKIMADASNQQKMSVRMPYRRMIKNQADQSLDLHTMVLRDSAATKNYIEKKSLENNALVILDVLDNRKIIATEPISGRDMIHSQFDDPTIPLYEKSNKRPKDAATLESIIDNRIRDIKSVDAGKLGGADVNKLSGSVLRFSGMSSLIGNWANSVVNATVGVTGNFMEAIGGEQFSVKDLIYANKAYFRDLGPILTDMFKETNVNHSRTNILMNILNVTGNKNPIKNAFAASNVVQSIDFQSLRPLAEGGEHLMHGQLMYAVMRSIRITNENGEYLDKKGNVVSSKDKAASFDEIIEIKADPKTKKVSMSLPDFVKGNTFSGVAKSSDQLLDVRNLIKKKVEDIQGRYDSDIQARYQRFFWGKAIAFLRKWIEPGVYRRWRGISKSRVAREDLKDTEKFFSDDLKAFQEGYYVTAARFFGQLIKALRKSDLEMAKAQFRGFNKMEIANLKKLISEISFIMALWIAYGLLDDEEDEKKNLVGKYIINRQMSEMTFYSNPLEALKIAQSPSAGMGFVKNVSMLIKQSVLAPTEEYQQGPRKGTYKITRRLEKVLPRIRSWQEIAEAEKFLNSF